jgi:uncharacterized protein (DUF302 family)
MSFTLTKKLSSTYEATLSRIPAALKSEGFGVLTEIDVAATLKSKLGVDFRRYKILGACNPTFAHRALDTNLEIGAMLPCNVAVYEDDDGRAVVHVVDPMQTIAAGDPRLAEIASAVRRHLERALEQLE